MSGRNEGRADGRGRVYQASGDQHITEHHHHEPVWSGPDSVRHPAVGRAPVVLRDRAELMRRLRAAVTANTGHQVFVLHGLGGCGKTAVAFALFEYATTEAGRIGYWINASDHASLRAGMLALAADRGAGDGELMAARRGLRAAADLVWEYLNRSDRPWLLVLDNADDPAVLRDGGWLRTSQRGTTVVTTRQAAAHWWPAAELLHVGVLPRVEAAQVLCDLAPGAGTPEEAAAISDRLGRLPLALTLAGGFLAHQVIQPWTMAEYGRRLDGDHGVDPIELIDLGAGTAASHDSRHLVSRTWQLSLDSLTNQGIPEAVPLLRLLACYSNDPLPLSLLTNVALEPDLPSDRVELALRGLLDHSLTELVTSGGLRCIRTHGVLLDSVFRGTPEHDREVFLATAVRLITAAFPENLERGQKDERLNCLSPHVRQLMRRITSRTGSGLSALEDATECALRFANAQHFTAEYASALAIATHAVDIAQQHCPADHPLLPRLRQRIARTLFRLGHFEEAETLGRRVLQDCEQIFGARAPETLRACAHLSYSIWGPKHEAVKLLRRAVAGRIELLGRSHPATLVARYSLLDVPEGVDLEEEVSAGIPLLEECQRELGPDHTITLAAEGTYACALFRVGRLADALPRLRESLRKHEARYGHEFPVTLNMRLFLAQTLGGLGHRMEAIRQAEGAVDALTRILGPANSWTTRAKGCLAEIRDGGGPTQ